MYNFSFNLKLLKAPSVSDWVRLRRENDIKLRTDVSKVISEIHIGKNTF
jgi:hypothetical protein